MINFWIWYEPVLNGRKQLYIAAVAGVGVTTGHGEQACERVRDQ